MSIVPKFPVTTSRRRIRRRRKPARGFHAENDGHVMHEIGDRRFPDFKTIEFCRNGAPVIRHNRENPFRPAARPFLIALRRMQPAFRQSWFCTIAPVGRSITAPHGG
ncbi:MAG: hypothetical protein WC383_08700 [Gammaproteobacteria bacterium]